MAQGTATRKTTVKSTVVPAGAKQPQDHQPPAAVQDTEAEVITVTVRGREWRVPAAAQDDFELLDDLNALDQQGDPTRMPAVLRRMVGDQWGDVMDVLRDPDTGRVSIEAGSEFVMELVQAMNPNS